MDPYVDGDYMHGFGLLQKQIDWEEGFKDQNVEYGGIWKIIRESRY